MHPRVTGAVQAASGVVGVRTAHLHDVDLAALGPTRGVEVVAQHPEGGPHAVARDDLRADLEPTVGLLELALRLDAGRREVAFAILDGGDAQVAQPVGLGVRSVVGIRLKLPYAPA